VGQSGRLNGVHSACTWPVLQRQHEFVPRLTIELVDRLASDGKAMIPSTVGASRSSSSDARGAIGEGLVMVRLLNTTVAFGLGGGRWPLVRVQVRHLHLLPAPAVVGNDG
jgi:hypothetical protein